MQLLNNNNDMHISIPLWSDNFTSFISWLFVS